MREQLYLQCEIRTGTGERCINRERQLYRPPDWKHWMCWEHYKMALALNVQAEKRETK